MITAFTSIAFNVKANRIVFGGDFTTPVGDPGLPHARERDYRRNILLKALESLETKIQEPTIFSVDLSKEG